MPLKVIVFSEKLSFSWKDDKLIINKEFIKQGYSLKIENYYTINSLDNNSVDMPIIKLDKEENYLPNLK